MGKKPWMWKTAVYPTWIVAIWVGLLAAHVTVLITGWVPEYPRPINLAMITVFLCLILLEGNLRRRRNGATTHRKAQEMQNLDVTHPCLCGHPMHEHTLDWERTAAEGPDCTHRSTQFNPYERRNVQVVCTCMEYRPVA